MNELKISISKQGEISTNLETLKNDLSEVAKRYEGVVVTEDTVKVAKDDLATLRKLKDDVETKRKEIKKLWNEPYNAFEKEVKDALAIIEKPIDEINKQVKGFEAAEKEAKENRCWEIYMEQVGEYSSYVPYGKVFDAKWLNKSTNEQSIIADINTAVTQVKIDIDAIKALNSEIEEDCLKAYRDAGNSMAAAIKRNSDYLNAKAAAEVRAREEAERKIREEQERKAEQEAEKEEVKAEEVKPEEVIEDIPFGMPAPVFRFEVAGGENIDKVKQFLDFSEIEYKEI